MQKRKIYLETTIFNYFFDADRGVMHEATVKLFDEIKSGKFEVFTSSYVVEEISNAPELKRTKMLSLIKEYGLEVLVGNSEIECLADMYHMKGVIPANSHLDSLHIAVASIKEMDYIISLNFSHINRVKTKEGAAHVNASLGYNKEIVICTPMEVIENE